MVFAIKKQLKDYQAWVSIAAQSEKGTLDAIGRYDIVTFVFVFMVVLFSTFILATIHINLSLAALIMHLYLGINMLKARKVVVDSLTSLNDHQEICPNVARFLNKEYSLFLVTQGKLPLTDDQIENLEVHKKVLFKIKLQELVAGIR